MKVTFDRVDCALMPEKRKLSLAVPRTTLHDRSTTTRENALKLILIKINDLACSLEWWDVPRSNGVGRLENEIEARKRAL